MEVTLWLEVSGLYAADFWVISSLSPSFPLKHVNCKKSAKCWVRPDPAEAVAQKGHFLSVCHPRIQERDWQHFHPGRVICTKVRRERNWLVSHRISKHCEFNTLSKMQAYLALGRRGT